MVYMIIVLTICWLKHILSQKGSLACTDLLDLRPPGNAGVSAIENQKEANAR